MSVKLLSCAVLQRRDALKKTFHIGRKGYEKSIKNGWIAMRYYRELSGTDWWIVNQRLHQNLTKTFRSKSFGRLRFEKWQKSNGSLNGSPFVRAWLTKGVFTWDRDELRPVWVRIGLHTFLFLRLHETGLNERDELLSSEFVSFSCKRKRISDRCHSGFGPPRGFDQIR